MTDATSNNAPARDLAKLYGQSVLLDRNEHRDMAVLPLGDFKRMRAINAVPVAAAEFVDVTRELPVAFVATGEMSADGKPQVIPIAMMGLREAENLCVATDGSWRGQHMPAALRRYPFGMVRTAEDQLSVVIDATYEGFVKAGSQEGAMALLDEQGEPTPFMKQTVEFLERFENEMQRTRLMCDRLVALDLLRGGEVNGKMPDGKELKADGFFMVDEGKLAALPDATVVELHRNGILGLLHMHLHSMGFVQRLSQYLADAARGA